MTDPSKSIPPGFGPERYGSSFADVYDEWYGDVSDSLATAKFIARFGEAQRILELGVGTGRLARPLRDQGHHVTGIDASMPMLERFTSRAGISAAAADMADLPFRDGTFDTVLVATNTFFNLDEASAQQRCLRDVRRVLRLGGRLVVEAMVPGEPDPALDRLVTTKSIDVDRVVLTATIRDAEDQTITGQHIDITEAGISLRPWRIRYLDPGQLDAIAADAGLRLGNRFAGWDETPFTTTQPSAVSVFVAV